MLRLYLAAAVFFLAVAHGQIATTTSLVETLRTRLEKPIPGSRVSALNQVRADTYSVLTNETGEL